jgi:hypothetical protein
MGTRMVNRESRSWVSPAFTRIEVGCAWIERRGPGVHLVVEDAQENHLSDAEINDLHSLPRRDLPWRPPVCLEVRARFSHPAGQVLGTAGFGFWNNPFDPDRGTVAPPNTVWFFYASPPSHMPFAPGGAPNGWKAAVLNGGEWPGPVFALGTALMRLPGLGRLAYAVARSHGIKAHERLLDHVSLTDWHTYTITWGRDVAVFQVDGQEVLRAPDPPTLPLGFVAWVDNNCARERPGADLEWRRLAVPGRQWLELERVTIANL